MAGRKGAVFLSLLLLIPLGGACSGGTNGLRGVHGGTGVVGGAGGSGGATFQQTFQVSLNRKLDILFMIDNSASMVPLQTKFLAQFPVFMDLLKMLPSGNGAGTSLPDLHLAVVSSDTGPGKYDLPERHCLFLGDGGRFQRTPRGTCTTPPLMSDQTFLAASMDQAVKNYTGDIADAFTCIAALGDQGCGFEGQLKSVRRALDPLDVPDGNQGFLRPDAFLAVIVLTNEDDCSVPDDSDLFDPTTTGVNLYGPPLSYRCNEFGHLCKINGSLQPPPRTGALTPLQGCVSNETATGKLTKVADEVNFLKSLKADPNQIFVAAITGPAVPYSVGPDTTGAQSVVHSCTQNVDEYADPAVRIQQWVQAFGNHGLVQTICGTSFAPAFMQIATEIATLMGPQCIATNLADVDPVTPGIQPLCDVTDQYLNDQAKIIRTVVPACSANNNTPPCWSVSADTVRCPAGSLLFTVSRGPGQLPNGLTTSLSCALCLPGVASPACP